MLQNDPSSPAFGSGEVTRCIWLPLRDEARIIISKYLSDVNHFHHIVHSPTMISTIEQIYDALDSNGTLDIGIMSLLLATCAAATYTWSSEDDARLLFGTVEEARAQATWWVKATLDVLDHAQRISHTSLECIQGMVILFYVFCNNEGLSCRARSLNSQALSMARELSMHRIDAPNNREPPKMGSIRTETYRRTWWFLVATDWYVYNPTTGHADG